MRRLVAITVGILAMLFVQPVDAAATDLKELAQRLSPSVVLLNVEDAHGTKLGTGFFVSKEGRIDTNHRVIDGAERVSVVLSDGGTAKIAGLLADDPEDDVAVLQIEGTGPWPALELGESKTLVQGEEVVVIGAPKGLNNTMTNGIVSRVSEGGTAFEDPDGSRTRYRSWVVGITAAVSPGSSGSPIMNRQGDVIAIAVGKSGDPRDEGLNFGIPIDIAKQLLADIPLDAKAKPFVVVRDNHLARNLIISGSVFVGIALVYFLWGFLESRRPRPKRRLD